MTIPEIDAARRADIPGTRTVARRSWRVAHDDVFTDQEIRSVLSRWCSPEALRESVEADETTWLVARIGAGGLGYGEGGRPGPRGEGFRLYVDPDRWRGGVGGSILSALEADMRREGASEYRLFAHRANEVGHAFWTSRGLRRVPERDRENHYCFTK